ncbi:alpha/beta hydrolase [Legionella maioricensis]|uniref:Alpha/beta hydrolase n=1 Tax=Legionella maioricensis TaxID=2896528 RepID=A0A9X2D0B4_9GAMM|nr:alpha/beta hydrolase [Legionella maioricensis]MCL9684235.1 alpha/beta hydrolase [Legionella maioricensis]MCL9687101.1 alpha/beta hydrolase [Legionella maioricensis]
MLKQLITIACVIFSMVLLIMYVFQRHLIYFPDVHHPRLKKYQADDMTIVSLQTQDNIALNSWYKPAINNQPTVLYLHGNAGHIGYRMPLARQFINAGLGVFLLEYRGYGGNKGRPSETGLYEDGRTALRFLEQQGVKPEQTVLYGESLGTGVATELAKHHQVCAVILQSPFTSLANLSRYHYPWLFIQPWDQFNSLNRITAINAPLLVLHGKQDQIVPYTEGLTIYNTAKEPKKMLSFEQKGHNNLWESPDFSNGIIQFIRAHCFH